MWKQLCVVDAKKSLAFHHDVIQFSFKGSILSRGGATMQAEIERSDTSFKRFFLIFNLSWMLVSICSLIFSMIGAVSDHPGYFRDWRGIAVILLALGVPTFFASILLIGRRNQHEDRSWPPPLP